jgi:hypothetical protein
LLRRDWRFGGLEEKHHRSGFALVLPLLTDFAGARCSFCGWKRLSLHTVGRTVHISKRVNDETNDTQFFFPKELSLFEQILYVQNILKWGTS